jgi:uncharacterized protein (TIRG00374 family)
VKPLLFKAAFSALLIYSVLHFNRIEGVADRLLTADPFLLGVAVAISVAISFIHAWRWILVITAAGHTMNYARAVRVVLIGYFFSHFLPTSLGGDVYRIWHTHRKGTTLAAAANSVILDRVVALVALLLMMLASLPWLFRLIPDAVMQWGLILAITGGLCVVAVLASDVPFPAMARRWKFVQQLVEFGAHARAVFMRPRYCLPAIVLSVIMHAIFALVVFITALAIHLDVGIVSCLLLVPPILLITMLPFSVAGWGLREGAMVVAFGFVNMSAGDAFALSVSTGGVVMVASVPGALLWLFPDRASVEAVDPVNDAPPTH